jgi:hypothetical protein
MAIPKARTAAASYVDEYGVSNNLGQDTMRRQISPVVACTVLVIDATANKICLKRVFGNLPVSSFSIKTIYELVYSSLLENELRGKFPNLEPQEK